MHQQRSTVARRIWNTNTANECQEWVGLLWHSMIGPCCVLEVGDLQGWGIRLQTLQGKPNVAMNYISLYGYTILSVYYMIFMTHTLDCHFSVFILSKASDVIKCNEHSTVIEGCRFEIVRPVLLALGLMYAVKSIQHNHFFTAIFQHETIHLSTLDTSSQHNNGGQLVLPNHAPEVGYCFTGRTCTKKVQMMLCTSKLTWRRQVYVFMCIVYLELQYTCSLSAIPVIV